MKIKVAKVEARRKALQALGQYKFMMFGYWAAIWVRLNQLDDTKERNPFTSLVQEARRLKG